MALMPHQARYTLHDGTRGVLPVLAPSSCAAVITAMDTFGEQLRAVSVIRNATTACRRPHAIHHHPHREASMSDHDFAHTQPEPPGDLPRPTAPLTSVGNARPIPFHDPNIAERRRAREERERLAVLEAAAIDKLVAKERHLAHEQGFAQGHAEGWRWGTAFGLLLGCGLTYVAMRFGFGLGVGVL